MPQKAEEAACSPRSSFPSEGRSSSLGRSLRTAVPAWGMERGRHNEAVLRVMQLFSGFLVPLCCRNFSSIPELSQSYFCLWIAA